MVNAMNVNAIGLWTMRVVLVIAIAVLACLDKTDAAVALFVALILSFWLLDSDD